MELIVAVALFVAAMIGAAFSNILSDEFTAWQPWLVQKIIALAVSWMPRNERDRWLEEWTGDCEQTPGQLGKIGRALGFVLSAWKVNGHQFNYRVMKRGLDIALSIFAFAVFAPLLGTIAIVILASGKGPILWGSRVTGKDGREVLLLRFRTLNLEDRKPTKVGLFLRRTGLEEIPHLWNVLRGDMALVGPRPRRPKWHDGQDAINPELIDALRESKPGIVTPPEVRDALDSGRDASEQELAYLKQASIVNDVRIIVETAIRPFLPRQK